MEVGVSKTTTGLRAEGADVQNLLPRYRNIGNRRKAVGGQGDANRRVVKHDAPLHPKWLEDRALFYYERGAVVSRIYKFNFCFGIKQA